VSSPFLGAQRALVVALGDETALRELGEAQWLPAGAWAAAIERVRLARFASLPEAQGSLEVGRLIGEQFLASEVGALIRTTLDVLPPERAFASLVPTFMGRLRAQFQVDWATTPSGGTLTLHGARATAPEVTLGVFQAFARHLPTPCAVTLGRIEPERLELRVHFRT